MWILLNRIVFFLALNENGDTTDMDQVAIYFIIFGITSNFQVCEKFLQPIQLSITITGLDIFNTVLQCVKQQSLDLFRLV